MAVVEAYGAIWQAMGGDYQHDDLRPRILLPPSMDRRTPSHGRDRTLRIFTETLHTFGEDGTPHYNLALTGRGKKNGKSADLILAALYRFLAWESPQGNDCFLLANDEGQAADDLKLLKKVIAVNPMLEREVIVKQKDIEGVDAKGTLKILPAQDAIGAHGKTYLCVGFDEIHGYRNWDIFEALAPDPTRLDDPDNTGCVCQGRDVVFRAPRQRGATDAVGAAR